jgi:Fe-S-cluster containining protein
MDYTYEQLWEDYRRWREDPAKSQIPDLHLIAPMVIPLKHVRKGSLYTCKHLQKNGDCGIYADRPQMCRDFPGDQPCPFPICASHGKRPWYRWVLDWLRT